MMECPMCFQRIIVPHASATDDMELIIKGSKATKRLATKPEINLGRLPAPRPPAKGSPVAGIAFVILLCAVAASVFVFRDKIFHRSHDVSVNVNVNLPEQAKPEHGAIGLGAWNTQVEYTNVAVVKGADTLYQSGFTSGATGWQIVNGTWIATSGVFKQTALAVDCRAVTGDTGWSDYTLTLRARKLGGMEGFLIMFNVVDGQNWTWWNIGGWGNTQHAIENCVSGTKSTLGALVSGHIDTGRWYDIRIELNRSRIRCYLDGVMIHDTVYPNTPQ